jgi:hypothetical protein
MPVYDSSPAAPNIERISYRPAKELVRIVLKLPPHSHLEAGHLWKKRVALI